MARRRSASWRGRCAISLPGVVQHLHVLEASGLVGSQKIGRVRRCRMRARRRCIDAERWIAERRDDWERRLDRLGDYLAENPEPTEDGVS